MVSKIVKPRCHIRFDETALDTMEYPDQGDRPRSHDTREVRAQPRGRTRQTSITLHSLRMRTQALAPASGTPGHKGLGALSVLLPLGGLRDAMDVV